MKMRQILIAAAATLVAVSPAFAVTGSYTESSMWGDLAADTAAYRQQSFPSASSGKVLATETGIYEQLAADHRMRQDEPAEGVAGPVGPTMAMDQGRMQTPDLRNDASIYEQVSAAQRDGGRF